MTRWLPRIEVGRAHSAAIDDFDDCDGVFVVLFWLGFQVELTLTRKVRR